uniref:AB hydrolase-1 domain-containing protein n=1 Tax=Opuntia streptacantha TaxID=393608 RepID=A0A7C9DIN6_OPUST
MDLIEWRYMYPLLEEAGVDAWAIDILGWGFSGLESRPSCDVASKRNHLYQVSKLVLIDASVYAEGTGEMSKLPRAFAYAGVALLKSVPLRYYVINLAFKNLSFDVSVDWMKIGRLHCLYPWWEDATVNFMMNGGYNVIPLIKQVKQQTLIIWGEDDQIIRYKLAFRLHGELQDATLRTIPECGHLPHVERPRSVADLIIQFAQEASVQFSAV